MSSKKGVKRGSASHTDYLRGVMAQEEAREHQLWWRSRQYVLDCVTIALGDLVTEDLERDDVQDIESKFYNHYLAVEKDVAYMTTDESAEEALNRDKVGAIWMTKTTVDRLIQQYVSPEEFLPFDERYNECREQPYTGKDDIIVNQRKAIDKLNDEITKLKGQIKLMKVKHDGRKST